MQTAFGTQDTSGAERPGFSVSLAVDDDDLQGILALQLANREPTADGFVTVRHTLELLRAMHAMAPSVVARDGDGRVVGYALVMLPAARAMIPVLEPMMRRIEALPLASIAALDAAPRWYLMGQVAVAASHRGHGVFDALYAGHRVHYAPHYDLLLTEISERNPRSMRAHARVGFRTVDTHEHSGQRWHVVAWDWRGAVAPR